MNYDLGGGNCSLFIEMLNRHWLDCLLDAVCSVFGGLVSLARTVVWSRNMDVDCDHCMIYDGEVRYWNAGPLIVPTFRFASKWLLWVLEKSLCVVVLKDRKCVRA